MKKNKIVLNGLVLVLSWIGLLSCTAVPELSQLNSLETQAQSQQYYYCESCNKVTNLTEQAYAPLEPDEPLKPVIPIIKGEIISIANHKTKTNVNTKTKRRKAYHKVNKAKKSGQKSSTRECVQWK